MDKEIAISQRLERFIRTWSDVDSEPEEAAEMLSTKSGDYYHPWLEQELFDAVQAGRLTPQLMAWLTNRHIQDETDLDSFMRRVWPLWFGKPYPGK